MILFISIIAVFVLVCYITKSLIPLIPILHVGFFWAVSTFDLTGRLSLLQRELNGVGLYILGAEVIVAGIAFYIKYNRTRQINSNWFILSLAWILFLVYSVVPWFIFDF